MGNLFGKSGGEIEMRKMKNLPWVGSVLLVLGIVLNITGGTSQLSASGSTRDRRQHATSSYSRPKWGLERWHLQHSWGERRKHP
jgi:hypothetical protein